VSRAVLPGHVDSFQPVLERLPLLPVGLFLAHAELGEEPGLGLKRDSDGAAGRPGAPGQPAVKVEATRAVGKRTHGVEVDGDGMLL